MIGAYEPLLPEVVKPITIFIADAPMMVLSSTAREFEPKATRRLDARFANGVMDGDTILNRGDMHGLVELHLLR